MRNWTGGLIGVMLLVLAQLAPAAAQQVPEHWAAAAPVFGATTSLSVSGSSSNTTLPATWPQYPAVLLTNDGSNEVFWNLGTSSSVAATTSSKPLPAGYQVCVAINPGLVPSTQNTYIAGITSTSTSTLRVQATGWCPVISGGGSGGGGGGGGAVYGPTAAGSAAANPPVLMGGTVDGTSTGNVDNWKVASGIGYITGTVGGLAASGAAVVGNPVRVGGENSSGNVGEASVVTWGTNPSGLTVFGVQSNMGAIAGTATNTGVGTAGTMPVDIQTSGNNLYAAITAAVPCLNATTSSTNSYSNGQTNPANCDLAGNLYVHSNDPCQQLAKTNVAISTTSGTTAVVTGVSAKKVYVCSLAVVIGSPAVSVSLAEGSSNTCGTSNQAAVMGVATNGTAANGMPLSANGGLTLGNGNSTVASTATNANYLCVFQSGTTLIAGNLTYVQQ